MIYNAAMDMWEFVSDTGDETKPIEEVYAPTESEEEKQTRLWNLVAEFSKG